tara:strand:- start:253 stop:597 length:345 start_codon:yes stop_codon:yes gene_type:complete
MDKLNFINRTDPDSLVYDCEELLKRVRDGETSELMAVMDLSHASKQIEVFRSVISYYRRQFIYDYVNEGGLGSMTALANDIGVGKQRISELVGEARDERLARVTGEDIVRRATS